jgi:hypothetical protein
VNPFSSGRHDAVSPFGSPTPSVGAGVGSAEAVVSVPPAVPTPVWERRQPQVNRRSVLPVEWFRRMPGGTTTYAPPAAGDPAGGS